MNDDRGSIWRKWDLHVHTPFSVLNNGFGEDFDSYVKTIFKSAIDKNISAIGITDYFSIDGYKKIINEYIGKEEKLKEIFTKTEIEQIQKILILPNIELRLHDLVGGRRINFHVIFSNEVSIRDIEEHFLHELDFVHESMPFEKDNTRKLKESNLIELGEKLQKEQGEFEGQSPLYTGMLTATVQHKDISEILQDSRFLKKYLIGVPSDEDLSKIKWTGQGHMIRKSLIQKSNFLFASAQSTIEFGLGKKHNSIDEFIEEFKSLKPCIWGSDSHDFEKLFEPDLERYCWIKADTTFEGLRQIIFEPEERVFIGKRPQFIDGVNNNPTKYFNKVVVKPVDSYSGKNGKWFENTTINFNSGLCAIIGNKGKGKSAIADILGLLGNSKVSITENKDGLFSFLNKSKFCKKGFAENFDATLYWNDGTNKTRNLSEDIDFTDNEKIKYIPQKFFEDLCSTQEDDNFREELNNVVFSRVDSKYKLARTSFHDFIEYKSELITNDIESSIIRLKEINSTIITLHQKQSPEYLVSIENKIKGKKEELTAHQKIKDEITVIKNPSEDKQLSEEQKAKSERISKLTEQQNTIQSKIDKTEKKQEQLEINKFELERILEDITDLEEYFSFWKSERKELFEKYELNIEKLVKFKADKEQISVKKNLIDVELKKIEIILSNESQKGDDGNELSLIIKKEQILKEKSNLEGELEKPFKDFHDYQLKLKEWETKKKEIVGSSDTPNSLLFFQNEKNYIENVLAQELETSITTRNDIVKEIFEKKREIQDIYNNIKKSISDLLSKYSSDQEISLETSFEFDSEFFKSFHRNYINRYGAFYQKDDSFLHELTNKYDFDKENEVVEFLNMLVGLEIHFKENSELNFLNYLFSLEYLNPRYNLKLNGKSLRELSPGERGGLLLIFYLILDKDDKPLVIDQPEDNLDNQSVSEILVPYIREAKKRRQIIMVTHNPNLAVVSDADQIIRMNIDKENDFLVSQISGAIENPSINKAIVDILEGKMKAFNNRRLKYQDN